MNTYGWIHIYLDHFYYNFLKINAWFQWCRDWVSVCHSPCLKFIFDNISLFWSLMRSNTGGCYDVWDAPPKLISNTNLALPSLIAKFMGPTWGPSGANRTQVGPMLAPWTLLAGLFLSGPNHLQICIEHSSDTAMLCAKFQNDWAIEPDVINKWNFARFEVRIHFLEKFLS